MHAYRYTHRHTLTTIICPSVHLPIHLSVWRNFDGRIIFLNDSQWKILKSIKHSKTWPIVSLEYGHMVCTVWCLVFIIQTRLMYYPQIPSEAEKKKSNMMEVIQWPSDPVSPANSVSKTPFVLIPRVDTPENIVYGVYVLATFCYCGKIPDKSLPGLHFGEQSILVGRACL